MKLFKRKKQETVIAIDMRPRLSATVWGKPIELNVCEIRANSHGEVVVMLSGFIGRDDVCVD